MIGSRALTACVTIGVATALAGPGWAVTFETMNGAPVQMQPTYDEPGAPIVTIPPGTPQPFGGASSPTGSGSGSGAGSSGSSDALTTILGTPWGATAVANAQAMGLNPSALAMTCVIESSCNASLNNGSYTGAFQMGSAAFHDGLATALAANPALASQIVPGAAGIHDPTTAAIAAGGYLLQGATALQNAGLTNPTALDVRGYYNFTPQIGVQIARSSPDELMTKFLPSSYMTGNNIPSTMTVGQWRDSVAAKGGNAANQSVRA